MMRKTDTPCRLAILPAAHRALISMPLGYEKVSAPTRWVTDTHLESSATHFDPRAKARRYMRLFSFVIQTYHICHWFSMYQFVEKGFQQNMRFVKQLDTLHKPPFHLSIIRYLFRVNINLFDNFRRGWSVIPRHFPSFCTSLYLGEYAKDTPSLFRMLLWFTYLQSAPVVNPLRSMHPRSCSSALNYCRDLPHR